MAVHTFIVSDESIVNHYGFRVMTAGINIKQYKKNPIVLWYHKRPRPWDDRNHDRGEILPIGKTVKLWKEGGKLYADIDFDEEDDFAKTIEGKVERGFINMCSPGLDPITVSDDPKYLLPGQSRNTLVKSELEEISIVDIGSNKNALRLSKDSEEDIDHIIPLVNKSQNTNTMSEFKTRVASILGLDPNASEDSVLQAVQGKVNLVSQGNDYKTKYESLKGEMVKISEQNIITLVDGAVDKKFTAEKRDFYITLGKTSGIETLKNVIENMQDIVKATDMIDEATGQRKPESGDKTLTFAKLKEQGMPALNKYRKDHPDDYIKLYKAEYGSEPDMDDE